MLQWLLGTLTTALPFLIPVVVLLTARLTGYRWAAQRHATRLSVLLYALSLLAFVLHAYGAGGTNEWFRAFYGEPYEKTTWCLLGYWAQGLSAVAILFAVNWRVIRLFYGEDTMADRNVDRKVQAVLEARRRERDGKDRARD